MHPFIKSRWFALCVFISVISGVLCLYVWPANWLWALLLPAFLWTMAVWVNQALLRSASIVWSLVVFLVTAAVGYSVAYNETAAWNKFCLIIAAVLIYTVMAGQPAENAKILTGFWFVFGVGVASYFLLTSDFGTQTVKFQFIHQLGVRWMTVRPNLIQFPPIHPNDTAGILIITSAYGLPFLAEFKGGRYSGYFLKLIVLAALSTILFAFILASSRGAFLGFIAAIGIWFTGWLLLRLRSTLKEKVYNWFPNLVIAFIIVLEIVVLFIPSGLLGSSFSMSGNVFVSRADVFRSGLLILRDFPFTGGGLASFPGLYSQYVLGIPFYFLPHSHNMFLDVMIEQGVIGGLGFLLIYAISIRRLLSTMPGNRETQWLYFAACISILTAVFHGMVDDYLYGSSGPALALMPAGMSILVSRLSPEEKPLLESKPISFLQRPSIIPLRPFVLMIGAALFLGIVGSSVAAQWYANLGAVQMSQVELRDFPTNQWATPKLLPELDAADASLHNALKYDPDNRTANYRLGMISMLRQDFETAVIYLERAYQRAPSHRGISKSLGYCYVWLGEIDKAQLLLERIPEAPKELDSYVWWWATQNRHDLSINAQEMAFRLHAQGYPTGNE